jgi:hypothetical protein
MFARTALIGLVVCFLGCTASFGQVMYGGYNLGPDYGAMVNQAVAQQNYIVNQATARGEQAIQWAMNNPQCAEMYRQHLAQGGQTSYHEFAMQFAGTRGFARDGIAHYNAVGQWNAAMEGAALYDLRAAEGMSGAAIQN